MIGDEELARAPRTPGRRGNETHGADYFIVCNQFWIHKDHATAFRAFARSPGAAASRVTIVLFAPGPDRGLSCAGTL